MNNGIQVGEKVVTRNTPELHKLALACYDGACNIRALIRELAATLDEIPPGQYRESLDLKIVLGQISFLAGDSLGPSEEALRQFRTVYTL